MIIGIKRRGFASNEIFLKRETLYEAEFSEYLVFCCQKSVWMIRYSLLLFKLFIDISESTSVLAMIPF